MLGSIAEDVRSFHSLGGHTRTPGDLSRLVLLNNEEFFFYYKFIFILFIFGCVGSSLLCVGFL